MGPELSLGTEAVLISNCLQTPSEDVSSKFLPVFSTCSSKAKAAWLRLPIETLPWRGTLRLGLLASLTFPFILLDPLSL